MTGIRPANRLLLSGTYMQTLLPSGLHHASARMRNRMRPLKSRAPLVGIAAGILTFMLIAAGALQSINSLQKSALWVEHTYAVLMSLEKTFSLLKDAQTSARFFALSGIKQDLVPFEQNKRDLAAEQRRLNSLVTNSDVQLSSVARLHQLVAAYCDVLQRTVQIRVETSDPMTAIGFATSGEAVALFDAVRLQVDALEQREKELLAARTAAVDENAQHTKRLILFGTIGACMVLATALLLLVRERHQRREAEQNLRRANDVLTRHANQLEVTNRELDSFSYSISHDLRIPLRAVSGYVRMIEEDYGHVLDNEGKRLLTVVRENSKKMNDLIDDLLNFSRLGRKKISAAPVDMNDLAAYVVNELRSRKEHASAYVEIEPLPPAWGDRSLLQQVWTNLVSNALKYSSTQASPHIRISASPSDAEVVYHVADNGVGFDMQYYDKLFGVFQRLHAADQFEGTGVGLAIVQRIVVRHGGKVWAEGKLGEGATFHFSLPVHEEESDI
ncbi:MAG: histidine kinase [Paucimonas sp.]|nr:histidine kinase [Paucimonas sp.]